MGAASERAGVPAPARPTDRTASDPRLRRTIALINGKGGVLKTSVSANLAGQLAKADYRVLLVDLDTSGDLGFDLGYRQAGQGDAGFGVVTALTTGGPLEVLRNVRERLDVVPGGPRLEMLRELYNQDYVRNAGGLGLLFANALGDLIAAGGYELCIIDGAPRNAVLQDIALAAARYVIIPTRTDQASWDGLRAVIPKVAHARANGNPDITYLGILITANQTAASTVLRRTRDFLQEVGEVIRAHNDIDLPLFTSRIRYSETAAHDCRARGELAHELAEAAVAEMATRFERLRSRDHGSDVASLSGSSPSLAEDYFRLATEVLRAIATYETSTDPIVKAT